MRNSDRIKLVTGLLFQMVRFAVVYFCVGILYGWIFCDAVDYGELVGYALFSSVIVGPVEYCRKHKIGRFK